MPSCSVRRPAQRGEFCAESMFQLHLRCSHIRKRCLSFFWQDEQEESLQRLNGFRVHLDNLIIASKETWRVMNYRSNIDTQESLWRFNVCKHLALPHCVRALHHEAFAKLITEAQQLQSCPAFAGTCGIV